MSETKSRTVRSEPVPVPDLPELATVTVPMPQGQTAYPDRSEDLRRHLTAGGRMVGEWAATRDAGLEFHCRPHAAAVETWVRPAGTIGFAILARFTRPARGTMPKAEIIGAARVARDDAVTAEG